MRVYINARPREERLLKRQQRCLKILDVNRTFLIIIDNREVANIAEYSLRCCQYRGAFTAPLATF
jgi:hypothetical protein